MRGTASGRSSDYQIDRSNYPIVIVENFLDPGALSVLNSFLSRSESLWGDLNDGFWLGRTLSCKKIGAAKVREVLIKNRKRIKKIIADEFGVEGRLSGGPHFPDSYPELIIG